MTEAVAIDAEPLPRRRPRIHAFELATLAMVLLTMATLHAFGMRAGLLGFHYIVTPALRLLPKALLAGLLLNVVYRALLRRPWREYLQGLRRPGWWLLWLRLLVAQVVMTYAYFWLKVTTPLIHPRLFDAALWRLDQLVHLGVSPSVFAVQLLAGTPLVGWLDRWYGVWVATVFYSLAFFSAVLDDTLRRRFALSCVLLWTLGAWLYVSLPAVGPCYVAPQTFAPVMAEMPRAQASQQMLWENYQRMLEGRRTGALHRFNPTRGVASLPSLHVGAHFLFLLWARRRARPLVLPFALATLFTTLGAVVTGWHYAIDCYAGMLLAWGCYRLALLGERGEKGDDPALPLLAPAPPGEPAVLPGEA